MFLYFNKNGQLVEIINDDVPHKGSVDYDKINVYVDGYNVFPNKLWATFEASDGTRSNETQVSLGELKEIPYNKKRDLKCFEYFKKYKFFEITIPENISVINGLTLLSGRIALRNNTFKGLDIVPFEIKNNIIGTGKCMSESEYNYLLKLINDLGNNIHSAIYYERLEELDNIFEKGVYHLVHVGDTAGQPEYYPQIMFVEEKRIENKFTQTFFTMGEFNDRNTISYRVFKDSAWQPLQINTLGYNGVFPYLSYISYKKGAIVNYFNKTYIALQNSQNKSPDDNPDFWQRIDKFLYIKDMSELDNVLEEGIYYVTLVNSINEKTCFVLQQSYTLNAGAELYEQTIDFSYYYIHRMKFPEGMSGGVWKAWETFYLNTNGNTFYRKDIATTFAGAIITFYFKNDVIDNKTGAYLLLEDLPHITTPKTDPEHWLYLQSVITQDKVGKPNGVASLDENGKVPDSQLPDITLTATKLKPFFVGDDTIVVDLTETNEQIEIHLDQIFKDTLATKTYVAEAISGLTTITIKIVDSLPTTGEASTIYFVKKAKAKTQDIYEEYMYIANTWELIGSTEIDLSEYAKTSYVDTELAKKVNVATERSIVHGTNAQGHETTIAYNKDAIGGGLAQRNNDGTLMVATPTQDNDATTKKYVDDKAKALMSKHTYIGDIYLNEFFKWCENTPSVVDGALFKVETETETPSDAISRGFPLLQANSVLYGYFYNGMDESPIVIMTDKGNYKITNGGSELTCEKLGGNIVDIGTIADSGTLTKEQQNMIYSLNPTDTLLLKRFTNVQNFFTLISKKDLHYPDNLHFEYIFESAERGQYSSHIFFIVNDETNEYTYQNLPIANGISSLNNRINLISANGNNFGNSIELKTINGQSLIGTGDIPAGTEFITINQPSSATNGNLTSDQLATLQKSDENYIVFANEIYLLMDKTHTADTYTYSHVGYENNKHQVKTISITLSTLAWVLNKSEIGSGDTISSVKNTLSGQELTTTITTDKGNVVSEPITLPSGGGEFDYIEIIIDDTLGTWIFNEKTQIQLEENVFDITFNSNGITYNKLTTSKGFRYGSEFPIIKYNDTDVLGYYGWSAPHNKVIEITDTSKLDKNTREKLLNFLIQSAVKVEGE